MRERFTLLRELGAGAFGVVHEAHDSVRDERVALKQLLQTDAASILRFKDEFRSLADLSHVNLVRLHELFTLGTTWCFTMELVEGVDIRSYVFVDRELSEKLDRIPPLPEFHPRSTGRPTDLVPPAMLPVGAVQRVVQGASTLDAAGSEAPRRDANPSILATALLAPLSTSLSTRPSLRFKCPSDIDRLRAALFQLAEGLVYLHDHGKLHLDIKPSNVLVTHDGRVVVLDLGLVADASAYGHVAGVILGTPLYMSPEQAAMRPLSAATDWYAVGVMLFEMLAGGAPFNGTADAILAQKLTLPAPPIRTVADDVPDDLADLCDALLRLDPERRPTGREILRTLRAGLGKVSSAAPRRSWIASSAPRRLLGRERHLHELSQALAATSKGPSIIAVVGESGVGKSALVKKFTEDAESNELDLVVLRGRCSSQESLPYHALDPLLDAVARLLVAMPTEQIAPLIPEGFEQITSVFPVLAGVAPKHRSALESDEMFVEGTFITPLRKLLFNVAALTPLIFVLDDVQWGDRQSGDALRELLDHPDAPKVLLILVADTSAREECETIAGLMYEPRHDVNESAELSCFFDRARRATLFVEPLNQPDTVHLAGLLFGHSLPEGEIASLVSESGGNPRYLSDLAQHVGSTIPPANLAALSNAIFPSSSAPPMTIEVLLDRLAEARVRRLSRPARALLQVIVDASDPLSFEAIARATPAAVPADLLGELQRSQLVVLSNRKVGGTVRLANTKMRAAIRTALARPDSLGPISAPVGVSPQDPLGEASMLLEKGDARGALSILLAAAQATPSILDIDRAGSLLQRAMELAAALETPRDDAANG